jgi:hypothetical protein
MKNNLSNTLLENALNLFLENNNVRTKKLNQRTSSFNLRTGIVSKEFLKGEEKYTIIPKGSEFVERLTSTSSDEIYTVNLNNLKDNDVTLLANRYKQKAYFISADTAIRRNLLNNEGVEASNSYVNKMPVSSKFLLSDNFGLGLRLSKDIGINYKLTFDNVIFNELILTFNFVIFRCKAFPPKVIFFPIFRFNLLTLLINLNFLRFSFFVKNSSFSKIFSIF